MHELVRYISPPAVSLTTAVIWSLAVAKGVGPVFSEGQKVPSESRWNVSWLMMSGINQMIGGIAGKPEPLCREELN